MLGRLIAGMNYQLKYSFCVVLFAMRPKMTRCMFIPTPMLNNAK